MAGSEEVTTMAAICRMKSTTQKQLAVEEPHSTCDAQAIEARCGQTSKQLEASRTTQQQQTTTNKLLCTVILQVTTCTAYGRKSCNETLGTNAQEGFTPG